MDKLIVSGAVFLAASLALAWLLVAVKYMGWFTGIFRNAKYLLSAHLDYTFMALLNWVVYLLHVQLHSAVTESVAWFIIAGSALNPFLFIVMSVLPEARKTPLSPLGMVSSLSFALTTTGYLWAAAIFARWV